MAEATKKKKGGSLRAVAMGPFDVWKDKTITAHFSWDGGVKNLKGNPKGIFTLREDASGSSPAFRVEFKKNEMPKYWRNVTLRTEGVDPPPLPATPLVRLEDLSIYDMLLGLSGVILEVKRSATRVMRLEGIVDVPNKRGKSTTPHQVRMVYLERVMQPDNAGDPMRDFVAIVFRDPAGSEDPNGGGSGPPD
jgi:hypothetical protein